MYHGRENTSVTLCILLSRLHTATKSAQKYSEADRNGDDLTLSGGKFCGGEFVVAARPINAVYITMTKE